MDNGFNGKLEQSVKNQLKENRSWFLALGIGLVLLGTLAVVFAFASTLFSVIYLGGLLLVAGVFEAIKAFKVNLWHNFFLHLFLSLVYAIAGILIIYNPIGNAITLTLLLAIILIIVGAARLIFAVAKHTPHRGWLAINGILTILLGVLIAYQWPMSGLWVIGMMVGIDMIFTGWTWIMLAYAVKKIS